MISKATHPEEFSKHITEVQAKVWLDWEESRNKASYGLPRAVSTDCSLKENLRLLQSCDTENRIFAL